MSNARNSVVKLRKYISVTDYGAVGDGLTNDTAAIQAALNVAIIATTRIILRWPSGVYLTTGSLTSMHTVRHEGAGVIKRGTDLFHVAPVEGEANVLYVSTSGDATGDGLSSSEPMDRFQNAFEALKNYGPMLDGSWSIVSAAGTYTGADATNAIHTVPSRNYVTIKGPTATHPNVPTCIFDGTGGVAYEHGMRISGIGVRAKVQDILFKDYTTGNSRIGLVGENESDLWTVNIHADTCDWCGIYAFGVSHARIAGGILDGCRSGFVANATGVVTFGYSAGSLAGGPVISNSTQSGVYISRGAQLHVDYATIEDNPVGLDVDTVSRVHVLGSDFKRNNIAIRTSTAGVIFEDNNEFNRGTADANTINYQRNAYTVESEESRYVYSELLHSTYRVTTQHTGTAALTKLIETDPIPAFRLEGLASRVRVDVYGRFVGVTAGTTIGVRFNGEGTLLTIFGGPLTNNSFELSSVVREAPGGSYRQYSGLYESALSPRMGNATITFDPQVELIPEVWVQLAASADDMYIDRVEVFILG